MCEVCGQVEPAETPRQSDECEAVCWRARAALQRDVCVFVCLCVLGIGAGGVCVCVWRFGGGGVAQRGRRVN